MHTSGFYFQGQVNIETRLNARITSPITGGVSGVIDEPFFAVVNTLFATIAGRRLGTIDDGTSLRATPLEVIAADFDSNTISPFSSSTRDVTLIRVPIKIDYLSRMKEIFNGVNIATGFAYAGPRYGTINREALKTFKISGTNYSIAELSKNVTFGTRSSLDGSDNTLLLGSTDRGRLVKTRLTMPAEISLAFPLNQFDNTKRTFDQTVDSSSTLITFDDTTP